MKEIGRFRIAFSFAGCFLGAGYVSGQELWQFFGSFGVLGFAGYFLALLILGAFGCAIAYVAMSGGVIEMDKIVVHRDIRWLRALVGALETIFLVCIPILMSAGTGAMVEQVFGISPALGSAVFCVLVGAIAFLGSSGVVSVFSAFVPAMLAAALIVSAFVLRDADITGKVFSANRDVNPLMGSWWFSAMEYGAYNMFCSIGVLAPLAAQVKKRRTAYEGIGIGCLFLVVIGACVILAVVLAQGAKDKELPMLEIGFGISSVLGYIYSVLLLGGMFGTSASSIFAVQVYVSEKSVFFRRRKWALIVPLCFIIWLCSLAGFGELIGVVFPICGFIGIWALIGIGITAFSQKRKEMKKVSAN